MAHPNLSTKRVRKRLGSCARCGDGLGSCVCLRWCVRASHQPHLVPEVDGLAGLGRALEDADGVAGEEQQQEGRNRDGPEHLRRTRSQRSDSASAAAKAAKARYGGTVLLGDGGGGREKWRWPVGGGRS